MERARQPCLVERARRRRPDPPAARPDRATALELQHRTVELRDRWLDHALCRAPADRAAAEDAIAGLYALLDENTAPAFLVHPEHGANGVAPGCWLVRRQQERGTGPRSSRVLVAD